MIFLVLALDVNLPAVFFLDSFRSGSKRIFFRNLKLYEFYCPWERQSLEFFDGCNAFLDGSRSY